MAADGLRTFPATPIPLQVPGEAGVPAYPALLDEGDSVALRIFADHVRKRYDAEPGFITMNMPKLLDVLEEVGVDNPIVCANINKLGFRMCGGIETYEKTIAARRFLPINVAETGALWGSWTDPRTGETYEGWQCDREAIAADRGQLWAEALHRWGQGGVQWREAEMLAKGEHDRFTVVDEWHDAVAVWLRTEGIDGVKPSETPFGLSTSEVAVAAIGIPLSAMDRLKERRVASVLKRLGYERRKILQKDGTRAWRYAK